MKYEEALEKWGALKLYSKYSNLSKEISDVREVQVTFDFTAGYQCCGGSNDDCYCSFYESPRAEVFIRGVANEVNKGKSRKVNVYENISLFDFDFATMIKELFEVRGD